MINNLEKNITIKLQTYNMIDFFRFFSSIIEFNKVVPLFIILYLYKKINYKKIKYFIIGICIIVLLKQFFKRKRPFREHTEIINLDNKYFDEYSFPSGHSFTAFYIAFILYKNINIKSIKNIFIIFAYIVATSRVYLGVHYLSDVTFSYILAKYLLYIST